MGIREWVREETGQKDRAEGCIAYVKGLSLSRSNIGSWDLQSDGLVLVSVAWGLEESDSLAQTEALVQGYCLRALLDVSSEGKTSHEDII